MTDHYQQIGEELMASCPVTPDRVLLYAEVADGVISADIFFQLRAEEIVTFRFAPEALRERIYAFWESGDDRVPPHSWAAIQFLIAEGRFTADLTYPAQLHPDEGLPDRRPRVVAQCFPGLKVDYSKPNG